VEALLLLQHLTVGRLRCNVIACSAAISACEKCAEWQKRGEEIGQATKNGGNSPQKHGDLNGKNGGGSLENCGLY